MASAQELQIQVNELSAQLERERKARHNARTRESLASREMVDRGIASVAAFGSGVLMAKLEYPSWFGVPADIWVAGGLIGAGIFLDGEFGAYLGAAGWGLSFGALHRVGLYVGGATDLVQGLPPQVGANRRRLKSAAPLYQLPPSSFAANQGQNAQVQWPPPASAAPVLPMPRVGAFANPYEPDALHGIMSLFGQPQQKAA